MFKKSKNLKPYLIGLFQALGISVYCVLVVLFFQIMENNPIKSNKLITGLLILIILVFSVAICGLIVFGRPVYLAINKKIKEALNILTYTFLYLIAIIIIIILLLHLE
jgi:hypothetical protein